MLVIHLILIVLTMNISGYKYTTDLFIYINNKIK